MRRGRRNGINPVQWFVCLVGAFAVWVVSTILVAAQDAGMIEGASGVADVLSSKDTAWLFAFATVAAILLSFWLVRQILQNNRDHALELAQQQEKWLKMWQDQISVQDKLSDALRELSRELERRPCFADRHRGNPNA